MAAFMRPIYKRSARLHAFQLRLLPGFRLRCLGFELVELALYEWQILDVEKGDVKHVADDQHGAAGLDNLEEAHIYWFAADGFDKREDDVAAQVGFADQFYFSRQFRAAFAMSPTEYRKRRAQMFW